MKKLPIILEEEKKRILSLHSEVLNEDINFLNKLKDAFNNLLPGSKSTTDEIINKLSKILGKDSKSIEDIIKKEPEISKHMPMGKVSAKGQMLLDNPTFDDKLSDISDAIDIDEDSIIKLMKHESGLDPAIKNSIGCVGLIQFCPDGGSSKTINGKTYSLDELRYDLDLQMEAIKQFWLSGYRNGKIKSPADLYIYNFFPVAAGKPDDFVLKARGLSARKVARSNPGFNRVLGRHKSTPLTVGDLKRYYKLTGMI
jgi:hypothetical protein